VLPSPPEVAISTSGLVVLVGGAGGVGSTFAARHFDPAEVVGGDSVEVLRDVDTRLGRGLLVVVDAAHMSPEGRSSLIRLAKQHHALIHAVLLDVPAPDPRPDLSERTAAAHRRREVDRLLKQLRREGFRRVQVLSGVDDVETATVTRERLPHDRREVTGPLDVVGDVHGCASELRTLLTRLGWELEDSHGQVVGASHPQGRRAVFVGDLVDRGPDTPGVLRLVMGMVARGTALCVMGNHEAKLARALTGARVRVSHGLAESLEQLEREPEDFRAEALGFMESLPTHYVLDEGRLVVAHAGLKETYHGRTSGRVRAFALYGDTTGETDEYGLPVRLPWAEDYRGEATVVYGHTPVPQAEWVNNTICLDTGVVFGGSLSALRYPEREVVSVPAEQQWYEPVRPLGPPPAVGP
jgi:predicted kinase